jgi:hypothetical protein
MSLANICKMVICSVIALFVEMMYLRTQLQKPTPQT